MLNGIRYNKLSNAVAAVRVHPDKYEKNFDAVVAFLSQYIEKKPPMPSMKVASVCQNRPTKQQKTNTTCGTFQGKVELKKYSREEYNSMSTTQHQQLYELQKKVRLIEGKKAPKAAEL